MAGEAVRKAETYQCAACGGLFDKGWSDEEAMAEREANGWQGEVCDLWCDDCYKKLMDDLIGKLPAP